MPAPHRRSARFAALALAALALPAAAAAQEAAPPAPMLRPCPGQEEAMAALSAPPPPAAAAPAPAGPAQPPRVEVSVVRVDTLAPGGAPPASDAPPQLGDGEMELHVDAAGRVTEAKVLRSTGMAQLDAMILQRLRERVFDPAAERRFPIPGCVIQRIRHTSGGH